MPFCCYLVVSFSVAFPTLFSHSGWQPVATRDVRHVLAAVTQAAEANAAAPQPLRGDALADFYVRRAALAAEAVGIPPRAFLVALGVALDHGDVLRRHPLTRAYLVVVENDAERRRRLQSLGEPSLHGRRDWLQHFAVSAALTARTDAATARRVGVLKELWDACGQSGFSFADLAADEAGIAFASLLLEDTETGAGRLGEFKRFSAEDYVPTLEDLEESIPWRRFIQEHGGVMDPRFLRAWESVRRRVRQCPGYRRSDEKADSAGQADRPRSKDVTTGWISGTPEPRGRCGPPHWHVDGTPCPLLPGRHAPRRH